MGADVADGGTEARSCRIQPPLGLLLAELFVRHHKEVLQVLDDDLAHRPHGAGAKQFARMAHERVARVVVGHGEDEAGLLRPAASVPRPRRGCRSLAYRRRRESRH